MRPPRFRLTIALLCVGLAGVCAAPSAGAHATFSGTVCDMLSPGQVAALHAPATCTPRSLKGSESTTSFGLWQPATPGGAHLSVTVVEWDSAKKLAVAQKAMQSLPGTVQKVKGIGTIAYESALGNQMVVNFLVGHAVVSVQLQSPKPLSSAVPFNAAAKAIAAKL